MASKVHVARVSVIASALLTALKLTAGFSTGSLALITEGFHSGIDTLATFFSWLSVKTSDLPADESHHYGHGKVENLAAFAESLMLFFTACWVCYEATSQLIHRHKALDPGNTKLALGIILISIGIDFSRALVLHRAAREHHSQALLAAALHFSVDLMASVVVLIGLALVRWGGESFRWADQLSALGVALIMFIVSVRLAKVACDVLLDRAPQGLEKGIQATIRRVPGVHEVPRVRARQSGSYIFVDATICVDPKATLEESHQIATTVELAATEEHRNMDITIHVEPAVAVSSHMDAIRVLASAMDLELHALRVREINGQLYVNFHLELPGEMSLERAHSLATQLENRIRLRLPNVAEIDSHLEPR